MKPKGKVLWRQMDENPPDFTEYYTKQQQQQNRELALMARQSTTDSKARRKADTQCKIILGGIMQKYLPGCKGIDPSDKNNFGGVANALAALGNDKNFLEWWAQHMMKGGGGRVGETASFPEAEQQG